jgi:hypothetical protein
MNGECSQQLRLGWLPVLMLALAACARSDFPAWLFPNPPRVSTQAGSFNSDMPAIASDYGQNVIVVWSSNPTSAVSGTTAELYWRRYNPLGVPQTPPIQLTHNGFGDFYPSINVVNGTTYIVWMGDELSSSNIYWGAVDLNGNFVSGPEVISSLTYNDYDPHIIHCGVHSHVFWSGRSPSNDMEIYYAEVRDNGLIDIPAEALTNNTKPQHSPRGKMNIFCTRLFIAYQHDFSLTDTDIFLLSVDTSTGSLDIAPLAVASTTSNENQFDIALNSALPGPPLISIVYRYEDNAGGETVYTSRFGDGSACASTTPLTLDSVSDGHPVVASEAWNGVRYALVVWERVESGTGADRDIYLKLFQDDCSPTPPADATPVSDSITSASAEDTDPQVVARLAPDGTPIYAVVWRTQIDGAVRARFGSVAGPIGTSERISDPASGGYPSGQRKGPVLFLGQQLFATWVGTNLGTAETWYQQTAWQTLLPVIRR